MRQAIFLLLLIAAAPLAAQVTFTSNPNLPIPDNNAYGVTDTINVPSTNDRIYSLRVGVRITHTYVDDLSIWLLPPGVTWAGPYATVSNGPTVTPGRGAIELSTKNGDWFDNYGTGTAPAIVYANFASNADPLSPAGTSITAGSAPYTSQPRWIPEGVAEWNLLFGGNPTGDWTLIVADAWGIDTGSLDSWQLEYTSAPAGILTVGRGANNAPGATIRPGAANQVAGQLDFYAGSAISLSAVSLQAENSVPLNGSFSRVALHHDINGNGLLEPGDTEVFSGSVSGGSNITLAAGLPLMFAAGESRSYLVVVDSVPAPSAPGVSFRIASAGGVNSSGTPFGTFPLSCGYHHFGPARSAGSAPIGGRIIRDYVNNSFNNETLDTITIPPTAELIGSLRVGIRIDHNNDQDLDIFLVPPSGPMVELSTDNGANNNNYGSGAANGPYVYTFFSGDSDPLFAAGAGIAGSAAPFTAASSYQPEGLADWNNLYNTNPGGDWTLRIVDDSTQGGDETLLSWYIEWAPSPPQLTIARGPANAPGATIQPGVADQVAGQLAFSASGVLDLTSVTLQAENAVSLSGSFSRVALHQDLNGDGLLDAGETESFSGSVGAGSSITLIDAAPVTYGTGETRHYLVVVDSLANPAAPGVAFRIAAAGDVISTGQETGSFPLALGYHHFGPAHSWGSAPIGGLVIPDNNQSGVTDTVTIPATADRIGSLRVGIRIDHARDGDLDISLIPPFGPAIELSTDNGNGGDDYGTGAANGPYAYTWFTGSIDPVYTAAAAITTGAPPYANPDGYIPEGSSDWNNLYGADPTGMWTLQVVDDDWRGGNETLISWYIEYHALGRCELAGAADFGAGMIGMPTAGSPQGFSVTNPGELDLTISNIDFTGVNPGDFALNPALAFPITVPGGAVFNFGVDFTPAAAGARGADLQVASDHNGAPGTPTLLALSGIGISTGEIDLQRPVAASIADGGSDNLGNTVVGVAASFAYTIANLAAAGDINITGAVIAGSPVNCSVGIVQPAATVVGAASSVSFQVDVTALGTGPFSFELQIPNDDTDENPYNVTVNGNGQNRDIEVYQAAALANPDTIHQTGSVLGVQFNLPFTIYNNGLAGLNLTGSPAVQLVSSSGIAVVLNQPAGSAVGPGGNIGFSVDGTPNNQAGWSFQLRVESNDPADPVWIINVQDLAPTWRSIVIDQGGSALGYPGGVVSVSPSYNGLQQSLPFNISNNGTAGLQLTGAPSVTVNASSGVSLSVNQPVAANIPAASGVPFSVDLTPSVAGAWSFQLQVDSNDPARPTWLINVSGNSVNPPLLSCSTFVDYGGFNVGVTSPDVPHTLSNTGGAALQITSISVIGTDGPDWNVYNFATPPFVVFVGGSVPVLGQFTPGGLGLRTAQLRVVSNTGGVPGTVTLIDLQGTGTYGDISAPASHDYGAVLAGSSSALQGHLLSNVGTGMARILGVTLAGPDAAYWSLSNLPPVNHPLNQGGSWSFDGQFSPDSVRSFTAQIVVDWDEGAGTATQQAVINVTGTGAAASSILNLSIGPDDGGPVRVQADVGGPPASLVDVAVTYNGGSNPGPAVIASAPGCTVAGNVIQAVPAGGTLVFFWDAYATEGHTTAGDYVITLSPSISGFPGTPGSSLPAALTRDGGWAQHVTPSAQVPGGFGHSAVFDSANDRLVIFGGKRAGVLNNEVWVLERGGMNEAWRKLTPGGTPPAARQYHSAIYDPVHERMVLFGGNGSSGALNDTWSLDLTRGAESWSQIAMAPTTPSGRFGAVMVLDAPNNRAVLHGGNRLGACLDDVWALELTPTAENWGSGPLAVSGTPATGRWGHAGAFDAVNNRMVVFGGKTAGGDTDSVFELSLGVTPAWTQVAVAGTPGARYFTTYGCDSSGNSLIIQSGYVGTAFANDLWQLPLSGPGAHTWTQLPGDATASGGRVIGAAAMDAGRNQLLFYGGLASGSQHLTALSALDVAGPPAWAAPPTASNAQSGPEGRWGAVMAFDSANNRVVLWGGKDNSAYYTDLWVLNRNVPGGAWSKLSVAGPTPQARVYPAFSHDPSANRLVMHGGQLSTGGYASDLWTLDLATATWTQHAAGGIPARMHHSVVMGAGDRAYVFGGYNGSVLGDAWYYDFALMTWNSVAVSGIGPRYGHGSVYDSLNQRLVVFAGRDSANYRIDVWEFDTGTATWSDISPLAGAVPLSRYLFASAANSTGSLAWMHGGSHGNEMNDLWELDLSGAVASWTELTPPGSAPSGRIHHMACQDGNGNLHVGFGFGDTRAAGDIWVIDTADTASGWSRAWQPGKPQSNVTAGVILDPVGNRLISFGGITDGAHDPAVWQLDLGSPVAQWMPLAVAGTPPAARRSASFVYDGAAVPPRAILYGGRLGSTQDTVTDELWALELSPGNEQWVPLSPLIMDDPGRRTQHSAIIDGANRMIVYGGSNQHGAALGDLFALDLSTLTWTQLAPTGAPPARFAHAAVYDAPRDRMVVFGGKSGYTPLSDAWELDLSGQSWSPLAAGGVAPGASFYHSMVVDNAGQRALLYGGFGAAARAGLYQLDLATDTWSEQPGTVARPQARWAHGAVWDAAKGRMAVVGGFYDGEVSAVQNNGEEAETWFWGD